MSLINYWPSDDQISECIRTEAEELAEHTLLAVHEPMRLLRKGLTEERYCSEHDLLAHFLKTERPIPIIGRSGVGKSHLIRWLDAQLKLREESRDWHIVRIPKNASLRQVLELLLRNLSGDEFDQARSQIKTVGEKLETREVAELLLTFMGQQLRKLYEDARLAFETFKTTNTKPDPTEGQRLKEILAHGGLSSLINDVNYKQNLLKPDHCIYQFASRLTQGASDDELSKFDYQIHAEDLNFSYNLDDLALDARNYVRMARLNTYEPARETAARVLNEVLIEANGKAFQQLFHFSGGNFQDLFKEIRRTLYRQGRTLVVLVEDMAAISAIEDVLVDSLLEEGRREGEESLCSLRSAIAVTDGYAGYTRRQGTIKTRARFEWWIQEEVGDEEDTYTRIIDFCSRYINAARHGGQALHSIWLKRDDKNWPPIWQDEDSDRQYLDAFGMAGTGVPLYPFNSAAIKALASGKLQRDSQGRLQFNPRDVLHEILLAVLRYRSDCEKSLFPPVGLAGIQVGGTLRGVLYSLGLEEPGRAESLVAIWGFGARSFDDLKGKLSADIALAFGMHALAKHLGKGVLELPPKPHKGISPQSKPQTPAADPDAAKLEQLERLVDLWFQRRQELGQNEARDLRSALLKMFQRHARYEWSGLRELPALNQGIRVNIYLPFAMGNSASADIGFCADEEFTDASSSVLLQGAAMALLRYEHYNRNQDIGWYYAQGFEDYTRYQNFATRWVPWVLQILREQARVKLKDRLAEHVQAAWALGVFRAADTQPIRMNKLLLKGDAVKKELPPAVCEALQNLWNDKVNQWDSLRSAWVDLVASNDHGMEGDLVLSDLKDVLKNPPIRSLHLAKDAISRELQRESQVVQLLSDCESSDDFQEIIQNLINLIGELQRQSEYPVLENLVTSRTLIGKLKAVSEAGYWSAAKNFIEICACQDVISQMQLLNQLDGERFRKVIDILDIWQRVYQNTLPKLKNQNASWGADQLAQTQQRVEDLLSDLTADLGKVEELFDEHA